MAVAQAVADEFPQHGLAAGTIAATVAVMQIPRGAHYLSDVIVGGAIGFVASTTVNAVIDQILISLPFSS